MIRSDHEFKWRDAVIEKPFARVLLIIASWPAAAILFWLFGLISQFMLLPLTAMF